MTMIENYRHELFRKANDPRNRYCFAIKLSNGTYAIESVHKSYHRAMDKYVRSRRAGICVILILNPVRKGMLVPSDQVEKYVTGRGTSVPNVMPEPPNPGYPSSLLA